MIHTSGIKKANNLFVSQMLSNINTKKALYSRNYVIINDQLYNKGGPMNNLLDSTKVEGSNSYKGNILNTSA